MTELSPSQNYVALGKFIAPWGLQGGVKFLPYHSKSEILKKTRRIFIRAGLSFLSIELLQARRQGRYWILNLKGYANPESAVPLKGLELFLQSKDFSRGSDEYYAFELKGLKVETSSHKFIGIIHELVNYGASDLLLIRSQHDGKETETLIPFIAQAIDRVDLTEGKVVVFEEALVD
ncbi:MAG: 16S rRNA processing protein RimM [Deltaproteobacteria bacterium]|nr:16S rRNA processing protein RimM [Deltaproteobacteria bacterium]